jgi:hypothetical protein
MEALFADRRDLLRNSEALAERLQFTLADLGYRGSAEEDRFCPIELESPSARNDRSLLGNSADA